MKIYIVSAKRSPQGRFLGSLIKYSAVDLAVEAGKAALEALGPFPGLGPDRDPTGRSAGSGAVSGAGDPAAGLGSGRDAETRAESPTPFPTGTGDPRLKIDQVIMGNVLSAGEGMNIARQVGVNLGLPIDRTAFTVNMMCASGMQAVLLAAQAIRAGEARTVLCGGTESMSNAPYLLKAARSGYKLGDGVLIDSLLKDGLVDSFADEHMGLTAETLAERYGLSREEQDSFALKSQQKYGKAAAENKFEAELAVLPELGADEHPRPETTMEQLAKLKPAFRKDGTVTPGNSSGINDGAAVLIVCDEKTAEEKGWKPLAELYDWTSIGCDPAEMGLGPVYAVKKLCAKAQCTIGDFDTVELNEAFAAQSLACIRELDLKEDRLNREGGAIALGHPIGTSGARLLTHLAHRINAGLTENGLATLCVGGGMGSAAALRKV